METRMTGGAPRRPIRMAVILLAATVGLAACDYFGKSEEPVKKNPVPASPAPQKPAANAQTKTPAQAQAKPAAPAPAKAPEAPAAPAQAKPAAPAQAQASAEGAPAQASLPVQQQVQPALPASAGAENTLTRPGVVDESLFDPKMLRNPFKPFLKLIATPSAKTMKPVAFVPKTPLQRFALADLKFVGIVWSKKLNPQVLIEDPRGKGYSVPTGTFVGNLGGKIVDIKQDEVVIEERLVDVFGEENVQKTTIKLHKPENEVNP